MRDLRLYERVSGGVVEGVGDDPRDDRHRVRVCVFVLSAVLFCVVLCAFVGSFGIPVV